MPLENLLNIRTEVLKSTAGDIMVIYFAGKITSDNVFDLNQKMRNIFSDNIYNVIIHLTDLEYMNSTGIAMFLTISKTVDQNKGKLILTRPSAFVKDLFEMTDLVSKFTIVDSIEEAQNLISAS